VQSEIRSSSYLTCPTSVSSWVTKIALILVVFSHVYALFDHHTHIPRNTYHSLAITLRNVMEMRRPFPSGTECSQSFRAGPDKIYLEPCRG
jgi:hypothetical protein